MKFANVFQRLGDNSKKTSPTVYDDPTTAKESAPLLQLHTVSYHLNQNHTLSQFSRVRQSEQNRNGHLVATATEAQALVKDINLSIMPRDKISIIGPNGAGKSTLVKLMLGLITPTSGSISRRDDLRLGYVPQKFSAPNILPLRVHDLLAQVKVTRTTPTLNASQKQELYDRLSITPLLSRQVTHLSGGETQRVLLTRALLSRPDLLILDEPMQGLDPESEHWLYQFIDDLPEFLQCAMVVVSHDLHWVMQGSRHVICLNKHICCEGQPSDLSVSEEFKRLFGHEFEQPYIHQPHGCQHKVVEDSKETLI